MPQFPSAAGQSPWSQADSRTDKAIHATLSTGLGREAGMQFSARKLEAGPDVTRRALLGGAVALTLAGLQFVGVDLPQGAAAPDFSAAARAGAARRRYAGLGTGSRRHDPAADPKRRAQPDRRLDAQRGPAGGRRFRAALTSP